MTQLLWSEPRNTQELFYHKVDLRVRDKQYTMVSGLDLDFNQTLGMEKLLLYNESHNKSRDLVLSYLHIGGVKYRIYSSKIEMATNIMIQKVTEMIEPATILGFSDNRVNSLTNKSQMYCESRID